METEIVVTVKLNPLSKKKTSEYQIMKASLWLYFKESTKFMQKCHVFTLHCYYTHYLHCSIRELAWSTQIKSVRLYSDSLPVKSCHCTVKNFTHQRVGSGPEPERLAKASSPTAGDSPVAKKRVKLNLDQACETNIINLKVKLYKRNL